MEDKAHRGPGLRRLGALVGLLVAMIAGATFLVSHADGPVGIFAGGPLRSGELVAFEDMDWQGVDALNGLDLEIVTAGSSRRLWFSVYEGAPYVACDLDCIDGRLERWPQQIERDDRVVIRVDAKRVEARLVHVPHGSDEYANARRARERKYSGEAGGFAAAETAAHGAVVGVGETLTGRSRREEPGDRLYRVAPRGGGS